MKYNTIITDLDRTLLRTDKSLSEYTISILKQCKQKGMNIIVASARPLRNVINYTKILDIDKMVLSNGSRIINNNETIYNLIPRKSVKKILEFMKKYPDNIIIIETKDMAYSNKNVDYLETIISNNLEEIINDKDTLKIMIEIQNDETLDLLKPFIDENVYYTIANGIGKVIQIMNKNATKWNGIKKIIKLNDYDSKKCIYFGDDNDDIIPLEKCGLGISPENAIEKCKENSDHICKTNDEDGVAHFLEEFILKEKE